MDLVLDILQGAGLAVAAGVRPLPTLLAAGGLAAGDLGLSFDGTPYAFLESAPFLVVIGVGLVALLLAEYRRGTARLADGRLGPVLSMAAVVAGALLFAGSLADRGHPSWPGLLAGVACAALAILATRGLLQRASTRLERGTPLSLYADAASAGAAGLAVLLPPLALLAIAFLARLAAGARRRDDARYAGLRILR